MDYNYYTQDIIYEPLNEYDKVLRKMHEENVNKYFDKLVEKSQINIEANKVTVKQLRELEHQAEKNKKSKARLNLFRILLWVFAAIALIVGIILFANLTAWYIVGGIALIIASAGFVITIFKVLHPKIKQLKLTGDELAKKISEKLKEAWQQMAPLNALFKIDMAPELFQITLPFIKLDEKFDSKRLDYLVNKFGLDIDDDYNRSTLYVQSGDINGNPFYISDNLYHKLGTKTYSGSIIISWTTTGTDSKGNTTTRHHSQVLTATITRPCPYYATQPFLVYGNEAAPDLIFTREDSDAEHMDEKQIERHVKREMKKLKKTEKDLTILGNHEFEILWHAHNRNNEVQFRLLFTVLAQRELLALMKDKKIGFGDDFNFVKDKMINIIYPEHLKSFPLDINETYFHGYEYEVVKKNFIDYQNKYFKHVYFTFAPILAIPLYQQHKPHEYIYGDLYDSYVSFYEHEKVANLIGETHFKHELSGTRNILKTTTVKSGNFIDHVKVTAYGYQTIPRTEFVTKMGRDGKLHTIPVHWTEYIPVEQDTEIEIHVPEEEKELTYQEKYRKMFEDLKERKLEKEDIFRLNAFLVLLKEREETEE